MYRTALLGLLVGCANSAEPRKKKPADTDTDTATVLEPAPLVPVADDCPDFLVESGELEFTVDGLERSGLIYLPDELEDGAPLVLVWHGRTGSPTAMEKKMNLSGIAAATGAVVIAPASLDPRGTVWSNYPEEPDWALIDALRTCAVEELGADIRRVHTTGFSAGGFFVTLQVLDYADVFASATVYSAGTDDEMNPYRTPAWLLPVLVSWGTDGDEVFHDDTLFDMPALGGDFAENLAADGHLTVVCPHPDGHVVPEAVDEIGELWFSQHVFGEPSPFADQSEGLPDYCGTLE